MPAGLLRSIFGIAILRRWVFPGRCRSIAARRREAEAAMGSGNPVARHYGSGGIAERVIAALRAAKGPDAPLTPENLAPFDHFHGRGIAASEELAAQLQPQTGEHLLDIGSGIGGPARWFAAKFGA